MEAQPDGSGITPPLGAYTKAKEEMLDHTHIAEAPWWVVHAVDKKKARLNCIAHLLDPDCLPGGGAIHTWFCPRGHITRTTTAAPFRPKCTCRRATEDGQKLLKGLTGIRRACPDRIPFSGLL